ncbi:hypothetical protein [Streptacidiphilus albus]|uniref:hypothetical protein n=1 Tax=Streptacidiphilus albus TaxID=105425 RepID=UPI00054C4BB0|nr:hypothetical protein [Streptacidiphilus albus]
MGSTRAAKCTCQCGGEQLTAALALLRRDVERLIEDDEKQIQRPVSMAEGVERWKRGVAEHRNNIAGGRP